MSKSNSHIPIPNCSHCGEPCEREQIKNSDLVFCCLGCKMVYELLNENDLGAYYKIEKTPGISQSQLKSKAYEFLDDEKLQSQLLDFQDDERKKINLCVPQIHCSSCIWLLENLYRIEPEVESSRVNFLKKEVQISFKNSLSIRKLVERLSQLGYTPEISLEQLDPKAPKKKKLSKKLIYQIGLAGFAFGNIMLMSLPHYFGFDIESFAQFSNWFGYINILLATPVALYSGQDYFKSAWISLQHKRLNIDVPIALGVFVLYFQSLFEILGESGPGYLDSLCGLLFFLLLGRIFQEKTYHHLAFERDYKSYFPISVTRIKRDGREVAVPINLIKKGDRLRVRNGELIPVDAILIAGEAQIDNSFASGESEPVSKSSGDHIYAGGKQEGASIIVEAIRPLAQSKLTRLWNEQHYSQRSSSTFSQLTDQVSQWFTPAILLIAILSGLWHFQFGLAKSVQVVSAVLIVACPCALALAAPFTFGHASRWLGQRSFYLRDSFVLEDLATINHLVFDKTGTLTYSRNKNINYLGKALNKEEQSSIRSILFQSNHPLSRNLLALFDLSEIVDLTDFQEFPGKGMQACVGPDHYQIGSAKWLKQELQTENETTVVILKNGDYLGHYLIQNEYRSGLDSLIKRLKTKYGMSILSGDNASQKEKLQSLFGAETNMAFEQSPEDKLEYIKSLQSQGSQVMMLGDGLNDAGALKQSQVGLALTEENNSFSPASDVILEAKRFHQLDEFFRFARGSKRILIAAFGLSFLYNLIGLSFAVQGLLSPVFAAILMPLSSITVVSFVSFCVYLYGQQVLKR